MKQQHAYLVQLMYLTFTDWWNNFPYLEKERQNTVLKLNKMNDPHSDIVRSMFGIAVLWKIETSPRPSCSTFCRRISVKIIRYTFLSFTLSMHTKFLTSAVAMHSYTMTPPPCLFFSNSVFGFLKTRILPYDSEIMILLPSEVNSPEAF